MKKKFQYKKYAHPDKYTDELLETNKTAPYEEIVSHSSLLTNKRIDDWFRIVGDDCYTALNAPNLNNLIRYFSAVLSIYGEVWMIFNEYINKQIADIRDDIIKTLFSIDPEEDDPDIPIKLYKIFFLINRWDQMIRGYLQNFRYFFRVGASELKGIEKSLEAINYGNIL